MFHTCVLPHTTAVFNKMNSIRALVLANTPSWVTCDNDPNGSLFAPFPYSKWSKRISAYTPVDGYALANAVAVELNAGRDRVAIDQLTGVTAGKVAHAVSLLGQNPAYWRRFGVYLERANTSISEWYPYQYAIDDVFRSTGAVLWECYVRYSVYNNKGTTGQCDQWLGNYFKERMDYLVSRRNAVAYPGWPLSYIQPIFGVTDGPAPPPTELRLMDCSNPQEFLDRMFYVWRTRSGYSGSLDPQNGGAGSYKWEDGNVNSTVRDEQFAVSWNWYTLDWGAHPGQSRLGPPAGVGGFCS